jgi:hypothetical protein
MDSEKLVSEELDIDALGKHVREQAYFLSGSGSGSGSGSDSDSGSGSDEEGDMRPLKIAKMDVEPDRITQPPEPQEFDVFLLIQMVKYKKQWTPSQTDEQFRVFLLNKVLELNDTQYNRFIKYYNHCLQHKRY